MDPVTAMAVVNTAIGIAEMFGSKDYSIGNLMRIQTEMLNNISKKLEIVQKGITAILENLDDLSRTLTLIPAETILELYKTKMNGKFLLYEETLNKFIKERDFGGGIIKANQIYEPQFNNEILIPLRSDRSDLMTSKNHLTVPIISTCLHIEVNLMLILGKSKSEIEGTLDTYKSFFLEFIAKENHQSINEIKQKLIKSINDDILSFKEYQFNWTVLLTGQDATYMDFELRFIKKNYNWIIDNIYDNEHIKLFFEENYLPIEIDKHISLPYYVDYVVSLIQRNIRFYDVTDAYNGDTSFIYDPEINSPDTYKSVVKNPINHIQYGTPLTSISFAEYANSNNEYLESIKKFKNTKELKGNSLITLASIQKLIDENLNVIEKFYKQLN